MSAPLASCPLDAATALGSTPLFKEPRLSGGRLLWLEQRPAERGRTTLMLRQAGAATAEEVTPGDWNLRSRVHEYGGGEYCVVADTVFFTNFK